MMHISSEPKSARAFVSDEELAYNTYPQPDSEQHYIREIYYSQEHNDEYDMANPQRQWHDSFYAGHGSHYPQPMRAPTSNHHVYSHAYSYSNGYLSNPNASSVASSSVQSGRHDTPRSFSEASAFSPPAHAETMFSSPELYSAPPPNQASVPSMADYNPYEQPQEEQLFTNGRVDFADPAVNHYLEYPAPQREPSYISDSPTIDIDDHSQDNDSDYNPSGRSRRPARGSMSSRLARKRLDGKISRGRAGDPITRLPVRDNNRAATDMGHDRPFHCPLAPYGCKSTFASKNEWKRHYSTQHIRLDSWHCDQCPVTNSRRSNEFNRKDLFMQHVRRMHCRHKHTPSRKNKKQLKDEQVDQDDQEAIQAAQRCHRAVRTPPSRSICIICKEKFSGLQSWEKRMEHIGKHFENIKRGHEQNLAALDVETWHIDEGVQNWMLQENILKGAGDGTLVVADEQTE